MHLHAGRTLDVPQVLNELLHALLKVLARVLVVLVAGANVEAKVGPKVLKVVVEGQLVVNLRVKGPRRLVRPASGDVSDGVAAAAEQKDRLVKRLDKVDAGGMALQREVEAAKAVASERVGTALQHDCTRVVPVHDMLHHRPEDALIRLVVNVVFEGKVEGVVLAGSRADVLA